MGIIYLLIFQFLLLIFWIMFFWILWRVFRHSLFFIINILMGIIIFSIILISSKFWGLIVKTFFSTIGRWKWNSFFRKRSRSRSRFWNIVIKFIRQLLISDVIESVIDIILEMMRFFFFLKIWQIFLRFIDKLVIEAFFHLRSV